MALYGTVPPFEDPEIPTDYTGNHPKNMTFSGHLPGYFKVRQTALSTKPPGQLQGEPLSASKNESIRESIRELMGIDMGISMGNLWNIYGNLWEYLWILKHIP